jgi:hypothetical protein
MDRVTLGADLYAAARSASYPSGGSITWHFQHALDNVDFAAK